MKTVEILAIGMEKPDFISRLIEKFDKADYSHIAILFNGKVYHAITDGGFTESEYSKALHDGKSIVKDRVVLKLSFKEELQTEAWLKFRLGRPYGFSQYLGFALPPLKALVRNKEKYTICSEIVAQYLLEVLSVQDEALIDADFVSPRIVMEAAKRALIKRIKLS